MTTIISAHQAYFIPWLGYFNKIVYSDVFVILDDVLFRKNHFHNRTQIIDMHGDKTWLTLPVGDSFGLLCNEVTIKSPNWNKKIRLTLQQSYSRAPFFKSTWAPIDQALLSMQSQNMTLLEVNMTLLKVLLSTLKIDTKLYYSSEITTVPSVNGHATEHLVEICKIIDADVLMLGEGGSLKCHNLNTIRSSGIAIIEQKYFRNHPVYPQKTKAHFEKGVSVLDALFNVGVSETRDMIYSGWKIPNLEDLTDEN